MSDYAKCARNGVVEFGDDFSSRKEIMKLFGKENEGVGKSGIVDVGNGSVCFFDEKGRDGWNHVLNENGRLDRRGWNEVVEVENYSEEGLRWIMHRHTRIISGCSPAGPVRPDRTSPWPLMSLQIPQCSKRRSRLPAKPTWCSISAEPTRR